MVIPQHTRGPCLESLDPSIKYGVDVLAGQTGCVQQTIDILMLGMNGSAKSATSGMISRTDRIRRRADSLTSVPS